MRRIFPVLFLFYSFLVSAQHQDKVDFIHSEVTIKPIPEEKKIEGFVTYKFTVLHDVDSIFLDAQNIDFDRVNLGKKKIQYKYDGKKLVIKKRFKKGATYLLSIQYSCIPKQTVYFLGFNDSIEGNEQIWTQGQGKYTSHWLPSFDAMEEKVEFDLNFATTMNSKTIVTNGVIKNVKSDHNKGQIVSYDMPNPMSSYLLAFAIGNYDKQVLHSKTGIPIENYYYSKDSLKVEPTYRYTKEIFDFLEDEIGYPYAWQNYKQVPVRDFLYAGMENTTCTIFSDGYVIDSTTFVDKNYVNVNAHELAHQWFGNLVTEKDGNHHWLHEGFATYYAQLAEKKIFGDDHYYWKLYRSLRQLQHVANRGEGQALTDPKASSLTFYEKGAWALVILRDLVGDKAFQKGIQNYLKKYEFKNVTISDFLLEMEQSSGMDLTAFKTEWLDGTTLPLDQAKQLLSSKSSSLKLLAALEKELEASQSDDIDYDSYWMTTKSIHFKKHVLESYHSSLPETIYEKAYASDTLPLRQALLSPRDLPKYLNQERLETFLKDKSYVTQEQALLRLWQAYPENRATYLEATDGISGLPNKNVRLLWLTLAMLTENYNSLKTKYYFDELTSYTDASYGFEIQQGAFFYLKEAFGLNDKSLTNLIKATNHHTWQFKKFARNLVDELLEDPDYKSRFQGLINNVDAEDITYLKTKLN